MKRKRAKKRHRWSYARAYELPVSVTPAVCLCGAKLYCKSRKKLAPGIYPTKKFTEDWVYVAPNGTEQVNPRPMPKCSR